MISKKYYQVISILVIIATAYYSFYSQTPSDNYEETNHKSEFSYKNALHHLKEISKQPHYTGSSEHKVVRDYIVSELEAMGLEVQIQEQFAINKKWRAATNNKNILARIKGSENGKALLLLSHYDSNPHSSLGASDAGSGVVVILEGIRTFLAKNVQPTNDIIICISDAEELGLLGANAFVKNHPWSKDVGLVLNFEARGSGGPSYILLETNGGNKNLIEAFNNANTEYPVGNSLMYSIYKLLPNDTDLTVFREEGDIDGFNFAFIGDHFDYHTAQDSYERMDIKSLKHQASYLIATLDYFSTNSLDDLKATEDYVYFNFPYFGMVFYPFTWVLPMFIICSLLFFVLLIVGFTKRELTVKGVLKGFIPLLLSLMIASLIAIYGWKVLLKIHPQYNDILHGFTYNGYYYIIVVIALTLAICFWFYKGFFKKRTSQDLLIAPLFLWLLINGGIAFYLQGSGFFILPVITMLVILSVLLFGKLNNAPTILFTLLVLPSLIIFVPLLKILPVGLGLKMMVVSAVFVVLLFGFLIPVLHTYKKHKNLARLFLFIGLMALITASINSNYSVDRKKPNSIIYVLDADKNESFWGSYNSEVDEFTSQFLGNNPIKGSYDKNTTASKYNTSIKLHNKTPLIKIDKPIVSVLSDTLINGNRAICLNISSLRNANKIELISKNAIKFKSFKVNSEEIKSKGDNGFVFEIDGGTVMSYYLTEENENIDIAFEVENNQVIDLDLIEAKYDLFSNPNFNITPRSEIMMPMPFVLNDATIIKTNIKL